MRVMIARTPSESPLFPLLVRVEQTLQLAIGPLLVGGFQSLQSLEAHIPGISSSKTLLLEAAAEQQSRHGVVRIALEFRTEPVGRACEIALFPQRIAEIEEIQRIARVAVHGFTEIVDS